MGMELFNIGVLFQTTSSGGFLLDTYTGASAAYSLRQLRTGVTSVVRVRRDSDNTEQDFSPTEITDGTLTTFVGAGDGFASKFYDQSGNSNDANQAVANAQPYIVESGVLCERGGSPCVRGYGDKWLSKPTVITANFTSASAFAVGSINESNATTRTLFSDGIGNINEFQGLKSNGSNAFSIRTQSGSTSFRGKIKTILQDQLFVADAQFNGVSTENYNNNVLNTGADLGTINANSSALMAQNSSGNNPWYGDFLEFVQFTTDETVNRSGITANINNHYSIY